MWRLLIPLLLFSCGVFSEQVEKTSSSPVEESSKSTPAKEDKVTEIIKTSTSKALPMETKGTSTASSGTEGGEVSKVTKASTQEMPPMETKSTSTFSSEMEKPRDLPMMRIFDEFGGEVTMVRAGSKIEVTCAGANASIVQGWEEPRQVFVDSSEGRIGEDEDVTIFLFDIQTLKKVDSRAFCQNEHGHQHIKWLPLWYAYLCGKEKCLEKKCPKEDFCITSRADDDARFHHDDSFCRKRKDHANFPCFSFLFFDSWIKGDKGKTCADKGSGIEWYGTPLYESECDALNFGAVPRFMVWKGEGKNTCSNKGQLLAPLEHL